MTITPEMEARLNFFGVVGHGISVWARMEVALIAIAAILLGTSQEKAGTVLYSINNFHAWAAILLDLMEDDPHWKPYRSQLTPILETLKGLNDTRVRLAHHYVPSDDDSIDPRLHVDARD